MRDDPTAFQDRAAAFAMPRRLLRGRHVLALTIGIVVGAGIFRTPSLVAGAAGTEAVMMLAWIAGGVLSIVGALCYAEFAAAFPHVGGDYHYLGRAFGSRIAFLYAWARLSVIQTGSIALLAYVFGDYMTEILDLGPWSSAIYAVLAVLLVTAVNLAGVQAGAQVQLWLTVLEVSGLVLVVIAGLMLVPEARGPPPPAAGSGGTIGLMMVFVLLTYGGWNEAVYVSAEVQGPPRRLGHLMVLGLGIVTLLYLVVNAAYLRALGLDGMAASDAVAADVLRLGLGDAGAVLVSLIVAISALTSANATAITGARTACALGRSFPALGWLGHWSTGRETPANALLAQSAIALLLVAGGAFARDGFTLALEYTAPVFWLFLLLVGCALFVLRAREPDAERPFRVPLYPVLPAIFCLTCAWLFYASLAHTGAGALLGVGVLAAGAVLLAFLRPVPQPAMENLP
ncbi:APC family permease [Sphingomonas sp. DT-204]|uniref:APC family permease n=1 Tax=Sphingomonas sp. DT-204 TaxID=3396166 RepID=UPI003F1A9EA1